MKFEIENQILFSFPFHFVIILYHFEMKIVNYFLLYDPREEKLKIEISVRDSVLKIDRTILKAQNRSHFVRSLLRTLKQIELILIYLDQKDFENQNKILNLKFYKQPC